MSSYLRVARIIAGKPVVQVIEVADTVDAVQLLERDPSLPGGVRTVRFVRRDGRLVRQEQAVICDRRPDPGSIVGTDCPDCGHNNVLHSGAQPCVACTLLSPGQPS